MASWQLLPWLAVVWICSLKLRESHGSWSPFSTNKKMGDRKAPEFRTHRVLLCFKKKTASANLFCLLMTPVISIYTSYFIQLLTTILLTVVGMHICSWSIKNTNQYTWKWWERANFWILLIFLFSCIFFSFLVKKKKNLAPDETKQIFLLLSFVLWKVSFICTFILHKWMLWWTGNPLACRLYLCLTLCGYCTLGRLTEKATADCFNRKRATGKLLFPPWL